MITNLVSNTCNSLTVLKKDQKPGSQWSGSMVKSDTGMTRRMEYKKHKKSCTGTTSDPPKAPMQ